MSVANLMKLVTFEYCHNLATMLELSVIKIYSICLYGLPKHQLSTPSLHTSLQSFQKTFTFKAGG